MHSTRQLATAVATALMFLSVSVHAQESANADLDACVKEQQIQLAAKGAATGAIAGLGAAMFSNKKEDALKKAAIGAAVGLSGPTYAKAAAVVKAAEKDPEKFGDLVEKKGWPEAVRIAVKGMLPKNKLRDPRMTRLKIFIGGEHPYAEKFSK